MLYHLYISDGFFISFLLFFFLPSFDFSHAVMLFTGNYGFGQASLNLHISYSTFCHSLNHQ